VAACFAARTISRRLVAVTKASAASRMVRSRAAVASCARARAIMRITTSPNRMIAAPLITNASEPVRADGLSSSIIGAIRAAVAIPRIRRRVSWIFGAALCETVLIDGCRAAAPISR
jgi:hypothetical protein